MPSCQRQDAARPLATECLPCHRYAIRSRVMRPVMMDEIGDLLVGRAPRSKRAISRRRRQDAT